MTGTLQKTLRSVAVKGAYSILRSRIVSRTLPFRKPPIMILSYPRSGSSWVGKILSKSPSAAYLREPITQQYLFKHGGKFTLVDVNNNHSAFAIYQKLSNEIFSGIPPIHPHVVNELRDFSYPYRKQKRLLIKEVNPRAAKFYCETYHPKMLLLIRHPAAIALSFYRLGWLKSPDTQMPTENPEASAWEKFGYAYGSIMQSAVEALKASGNHEIVVYRHLAQDPYTQFRRLFRALGLEIPDNYDEIIDRYCYSPKEIRDRGELERTSRNMIFKWQNELTSDQICDLQNGYFQSGLGYFRDARDWQSADGGAYS